MFLVNMTFPVHCDIMYILCSNLFGYEINAFWISKWISFKFYFSLMCHQLWDDICSSYTFMTNQSRISELIEQEYAWNRKLGNNNPEFFPPNWFMKGDNYTLSSTKGYRTFQNPELQAQSVFVWFPSFFNIQRIDWKCNMHCVQPLWASNWIIENKWNQFPDTQECNLETPFTHYPTQIGSSGVKKLHVFNCAKGCYSCAVI